MAPCAAPTALLPRATPMPAASRPDASPDACTSRGRLAVAAAAATPGLAAAAVLAAVLAAAPAASAQIAIAGYVFDAAAAADVATPQPGSHPEFGGVLAGCGTVAALSGQTLDQSLDTVLTDDGATEWVFGDAIVRLDFTDNAVLNGPGPDLVVFEIGGAEGFALSVLADTVCEYGPTVAFTPVPTGFIAPCGAANHINAAAIDLDALGVLPGATVRTLRLDNLGTAGGAIGADIAAVMALHSVAPVATAPPCLLSFQQGTDSGTGVFAGAADTAIASDAPATNYAAAPLEYVDGSPERQLLLRFDGIVGNAAGQIPPGATITRATLTLCSGPGAGDASTGTHTVHRVLQPWTAGTLTWASGFGGNGIAADGVEASTALATVAAMSANAVQSLDVTAAVQAWADGAPNRGLALLSDHADALGLHLSEAALATFRPALTVEVLGKLRFAEAVASFTPAVSGGEPSACILDPSFALGAPDYVSYSPSTCCPPIITTVTLGNGGTLVLEFSSVSISGNGSPEPDLWIYERGPDVEDTFVDVSADGVTWHSLGKVFGAVSSVDLDSFGWGPLHLFRYVRLVDDVAEGQSTGCSHGADIDAVAALAPNPWVNLGSGLTGTTAPQLAASGALAPGGLFQLVVSNALPNGSAYLVLGTSLLNQPLKGGTLVPFPTVLVSGLPLGPAGTLVLPALWPAGIPAGLGIYLQFWIPDAGGPVGFAATNGLKSVTQ
jgi:hypothetical protein